MIETIEPGTLYVVSTPIGNLQDITLRAINILGGVDVIAAEDTRTTRVLLDHLSISRPIVSYHSHNEFKRIPALLDRLDQGEAVAVVTDAGTPGISDPAYALVRAAAEAGKRIIPIPGASAVLSALVVSGLPMDRFVFEGFLPLKKGRSSAFARLSEERRTIVIYESPHRIVKTVQEIHDRLGDRTICVARELTKKFEEVLRGQVSDVIEHLKSKTPRGEYVIVLAGAPSETKSHATVSATKQD